MRKPIVAGNWKMNKTATEAVELVAALKTALADCTSVDVVLCPPFTALSAASQQLSGSIIGLGAQNMHWEASGAYTGEISVGMLRDLFCHYVILGHSERRAYFGETSEIVNKKVLAALAGNLRPIVCVGETLQERESGSMQAVVEDQVRKSLANLTPAQWANVIIAYEPVWAIGTGKTATPAQAQEVHAFIRQIVTAMTDGKIAQAVRIQYGGSVKASNAKEIFGQPDIDGGLIGGAALEAQSFADIVRAAAK